MTEVKSILTFSNDGKFIYNYPNNKLIYELNPAGGINNSIYAENAFALTDLVKVVSLSV